MKGKFTGSVWDDNETITVNEGKVYWPSMGWQWNITVNEGKVFWPGMGSQWNNNSQWKECLLARYGMTMKQ